MNWIADHPLWSAFIGLLMVGALVVSIYAIKAATAPVRGAIDARERIQADGAVRIGAYNYFFDLCSSIQGQEGRLAALEEELERDVDDTRRYTINASITAIMGSRAAMIARYNADAAKDWTIGQFKSSKLPYHLDLTTERTTCVLA